MTAKSDRRRHYRVNMPGKMRLYWQDSSGQTFSAMARCVDISRSGVKVEVPRRIEARTMVNVQSNDFRLAGIAMVRHCVQEGLRYFAGLEFGGGLEWRSRTQPPPPPAN